MAFERGFDIVRIAGDKVSKVVASAFEHCREAHGDMLDDRGEQLFNGGFGVLVDPHSILGMGIYGSFSLSQSVKVTIIDLDPFVLGAFLNTSCGISFKRVVRMLLTLPSVLMVSSTMTTTHPLQHAFWTGMGGKKLASSLSSRI